MTYPCESGSKTEHGVSSLGEGTDSSICILFLSDFFIFSRLHVILKSHSCIELIVQTVALSPPFHSQTPEQLHPAFGAVSSVLPLYFQKTSLYSHFFF